MLCQEEGQGSKSKTQGPKRGRENFVSAAIGDEVLVWGGVKPDMQMVDAALWSFNVHKRKWQMLHNGRGTRPEPTELAASFVIQDTLYIHGGQDTHNCSQVRACMHTHIHTHACMHADMHKYMHACMHSCKQTRIHAYTGTILGMETRGTALETAPNARGPSALAHRGCWADVASGRGQQNSGSGVWGVLQQWVLRRTI